jgi:hypothetical protein
MTAVLLQHHEHISAPRVIAQTPDDQLTELLVLESRLKQSLSSGMISCPPSLLSAIFGGAKAWRLRPLRAEERKRFETMRAEVLSAIERARFPKAP